jgi:hypothetical protein
MTSADSVNLGNFPQQLANALGLTGAAGLFAGQILATVILMSIVMVPFLYFTKGKNPMMAFIVGFMMVCFGVAMSWVPIWTFAVLGLALAVMFGKKIVEMF